MVTRRPSAALLLLLAPCFRAWTSAGNFVLALNHVGLVATRYPDTPIDASLGTHDSPISVAKAERILGWVPEETWRDGVSGLKEPESCEGAVTSDEKVWARRARAAGGKL